MIPGTVLFYDYLRGFGKITTTEGEAFVHISRLSGDGFRYLAPKERVLVELGLDQQARPCVIRLERAEGRFSGIVTGVDEFKGSGIIKGSGSEEIFFFHLADVLTPTQGCIQVEPGCAVEFETKETQQLPRAIRVKILDPRHPIDRYAFLRNVHVSRLAALAQPELWGFEGPDDLGILHNYIRIRFSHTQKAGLVLEEETHSIFNTGLVTKWQEPIYALFARNQAAEKTGIPWYLDGFFVASNRKLMSTFSKYPEALTYNFQQGARFDPNLKIVVAVRHIFKDRSVRLPYELQRDPSAAQSSLEQAVQKMVEEARRNPQIAAVQVNRGQPQLLLPLYLMGREAPDVALVLSRVGEMYRGHTVLGLKEAYRGARVIGPPKASWLIPKPT